MNLRFVFLLLVALSLSAAVRAAGEPASGFVAEAGCAGCHPDQQRAHAGSQHARAMQPATPETVRGDFSGVTFRKDGVTSTFFRRGGRFFVNTDGPDGRLSDFEVRFTFGLAPLQQYLVAFPGGRLQALPIAWDVDGKRWFHTYGDERIDHRDVLHWTRLAQNWNAMCAACHATDVRKNYAVATDAYSTTHAGLGVGCQGCHGPAAGHLAWAKAGGGKGAESPGKGFAADLRAGHGSAQADACGYCHSLRATLTADYPPGRPLLDHALPARLDADGYFNDGQQRGEVFNLGSWLQSAMNRKGVTCSDCHDPHSGRTKAPGNALCVGCHNPTGAAAGPHIDTRGLRRVAYDKPAHHHHAGPIGCVDCHAPKRRYMVVDPRLDHAFRIPRPDLAAATGSPDACTQCHADRDAGWAAAAVARWYGVGRRAEFHFGQAFAAARGGQPGAAAGLLRVAADRNWPPIVRAEALELLTAYPGARAQALARAALDDEDGLVRVAAIHAVMALDPVAGLRTVPARLSDPLRAVRIEAARLLAPGLARLAPERQQAWQAARRELEAAAAENADFPQSWLGLANLAQSMGELAEAERALRQSLKLEPAFVPGIANLADLLRRTGREPEAEATLRAALRRIPDNAPLHEALGLALVRQQKKPEALQLLARASALPSASGRTTYLYAAMLADAGRLPEAIEALRAATRERGERDLLLALAGFGRQAGDPETAERALRRLAEINPDDPALAGPR